LDLGAQITQVHQLGHCFEGTTGNAGECKMKVRTAEEIAQANITTKGKVSTDEALRVAYSAVEEVPSGLPNRQRVLATLRDMLLAEKK
jgi:hypothetical protein